MAVPVAGEASSGSGPPAIIPAMAAETTSASEHGRLSALRGLAVALRLASEMVTITREELERNRTAEASQLANVVEVLLDSVKATAQAYELM